MRKSKGFAFSEDFLRRLALPSEEHAAVRAYLKKYYDGAEISLDPERDSTFFDAVSLEFGLSMEEVGKLTLTQIDFLFRHVHRLNVAANDHERTRIQTELVNAQKDLRSRAFSRDGVKEILLKALAYAFPSGEHADEHADLETERDKFFHSERSKRGRDKISDEAIILKAKRLHPEWDCDLSISGMRARADKYAVIHLKMPPIQRREYRKK